jgi:hypothetical protein
VFLSLLSAASGSTVVPLLATHFQSLTELGFISIRIKTFVLNFYVVLTSVVQMTLLMETDISYSDLGLKCNYTLEKYGHETCQVLLKFCLPNLNLFQSTFGI